MTRPSDARGPATRRRRAGRAGPGRFIVLTGLSGAGKSQAIRALEDLGYFCVDNLPSTLIPTLAELSQHAGSEIPKVAIVVDVREGGFLGNFPPIFRRLRAMRGLRPRLIFLEASDEVLVRRFSETRRPHPLARRGSVAEAIRDERRRLAPIRALADQIVDTTALTVHELRRIFRGLSRDSSTAGRLAVTLQSFGFKHGLPMDADLVFDVRCLPNPYFVPRLRSLTGRDRAVVRYMQRHKATGLLIGKLLDLLRFLVPHYVAEGKTYLTVAIGCTGGRHRSVMVAEALRKGLVGVKAARTRVKHRDIGLRE